jgi:hypothetical protein
MTFPLVESITAGTTIGHANDHVDIAKLLNSTVNSQSGTAYTLALTDFGRVIETTSASAVTVTVPPNSSVAFPIGTIVEVAQLAAGAVTIAQGSGVTIRVPTGLSLALRAQYSSAVLRKRATDEWIIGGDLL